MCWKRVGVGSGKRGCRREGCVGGGGGVQERRVCGREGCGRGAGERGVGGAGERGVGGVQERNALYVPVLLIQGVPLYNCKKRATSWDSDKPFPL